VALETRTIKLRVNVANPDGRLKPGMFVRAMVRPVIAGEGRVVADSLAGKFICPMHPEIVKDAQAPCDICGMDLVPAERLGYVSAAGDGERPPLVIPATAPLITGTRAIVYVQLPDRDRPTFEGRQIALGPKAGDFYLVREDGAGGLNLAEGDLVVVRGNFKIDSALQIQARKSMMSPPADQPPPATAPAMASGPVEAAPVVEPVDAPGEFVAGLTPLYDAYLRVQAALAADDLAAFRDAAPAMHAALDAIDASALPPTIRPIWVDLAGRLATQREHVGHLADLDAARGAFETWSNAMIELGRGFGFEGPDQIVIAYCPMAFDFKGASWLQVGQQINNPYFGATMLRCGEVKGTLAAPVRREGIDD
jgi:Cu(I)/Ag(I) efflux system membrane fusion protein